MGDKIIVIQNNKTDCITLELSEIMGHYKVKASNNEEIDTIIKHMERMNRDIQKYTFGDCLACFSSLNQDKYRCGKCKQHINFVTRKQCGVCYIYLCQDCAKYAYKNLREYREIIFQYIKK